MSLNYIPTVGSKGVYKLAAPFDQLMAVGEYYICKSVRKISEILANNDDPEKLVYTRYGLDQEIYTQHKTEDMEIVYLQSEKGHWLYVPASFIQEFPDPNGVIYRAVGISVLLPAIPVGYQLDQLKTEITGMVKDITGLRCTIKQTFTSRPLAVPVEKHEATQQTRAIERALSPDIYSRYRKLQLENDILAAKVQALEQHIRSMM